MSAPTFLLLVAGMLGAAFVLTLTFVTAAAVVYAAAEGHPGSLTVYVPTLLGCLLVWAVVGLEVRREPRRPGSAGRSGW